jgi:predicted nucleic acid-binding protein
LSQASGLAGSPVYEAVGGSLHRQETLLNEGSQVALQAPAVDSWASGLEILYPELRPVSRELDGHTLASIVYAEVSIGYTTIEALDAAIPAALYRREALPWEAGFLAGKCFAQYRRRGGLRLAPLPDFYIGAHAAIGRLALLTRDAARYRSYFPGVEIIAPSKGEKKAGRAAEI